jgi:pullulanase/glycogen debranching enzyme
LNGSGIGTFNDRLRDAARGTRHGDDVATTVARKGWLNGAQGRELGESADLIRAGLAGSVRDVRLPLHDGRTVASQELLYGGQPAAYVREPAEAVNYVENHDNPTLFDLNAFKLPLDVTALERAQIQVLGSALVALSQGVAYWHAGQDILRSKSMDLNSFDSGDWFNRLDWSLRDNGYAAGLPPGADSRPFWPVIAPRLAKSAIKPTPELIRFSREAHLDLLRLRASTPLLRLPSAQAIRERITFPGVGQTTRSDLIAVHLDGRGLTESPHAAVLIVFNASAEEGRLMLQPEESAAWVLHPVLASAQAADARIRAQSRWLPEVRQVVVPPRSAVVWVTP